MAWVWGTDHIVRLYDGDITVNLHMTSMRSRWQYEVYRNGTMLKKSDPFVQIRRAKKSAENYLEKLNAKEANLPR